MEELTLKLTIDLKYFLDEINEEEVLKLKDNLAWMIRNAYSNGVFTEGSEAELDDYNYYVEETTK